MRAASKAEPVALALLAYVPFLASSPGRVSADSKQYLYLDPGAFLSRAADLWDPHVGAGTVPHQHLGYLFPTGPWFWALDRLGVPDWVAQRLWLGTLTLCALLGARWLFRQVGTGPVGALAGALVYGLSPYQLAFTARMSVLLLPWAALPWLVGLTMRATRERSWRAPAALALVLVLVGGINASSLLLVGLAPVLWVVLEALRAPERWRPVLGGLIRIAVVSLGVSAWWLVGIRVQGAYGLPVLQLTENVGTVAEHSAPGDVLRGLGNWFFYGRDRTGYSLEQAGDYASRDLLVVLTYAIPVAGLVAGLLLRWAHRAYFGLLVVVGTIVAVGAYPFDEPTPYGRAWRSLTTDFSVGLALRNSPRAVPLIVLGLAGLLAASVGALPRPRWRALGGAAVAALALGALLPVWETGWLSEGQDRPEDLPAYWQEVADAIDAGDDGTRVLELPGASFASYTWGTTVDPVLPGLIDRPSMAREVLPYGTPPSVNLLDALDRRLQLGVLEGDAIAPVARLLGVGTIAFRGDLDQSGRFDTAAPGPVWDLLRGADDLSRPRSFGPAPQAGDGAPPVALFEVDDAVPIVHVASPTGPVVLAGDGDGIVDAAAAGLLDGRTLVLESAALDDDGLAGALARGAHLVVTDSNRKRSQTWFYAIRDTKGPTERVDQEAPDPTGYDFRLSPFPNAPPAAQTVVRHVGGQVDTTMEGGPERPEDRGTRAFDGDPSTAWRVAGTTPVGAAITVTPEAPVTIARVRLLQPPSASGGRRVTQVVLRFDEGEPVAASLGPESLDGGQVVTFPERTVRRLTVEIAATDPPAPTLPEASTPVGFAEIDVPGVHMRESVVVPGDLLGRAGPRLEGHGLDIVLTRLRRGVGPERMDEEAWLDRTLELPLARRFALRGTIRGTLDDPADARCRDDLVEADGVPVAVRLAASGAGVVRLESCDEVALGPGTHRIVAAGGGDAALTIDRLVLSTGGSGTPAPAGVRGRTEPLAARPGAAGSDRVDLTVEPQDGEPFWVVLGQSDNAGWEAHADAATVGSRQLVDGYANAWLVTPSESGPVHIELRWRPQRLLWLGLAVSAVALVACLAILLRRRRDPSAPAVGPVPALVPLHRRAAPSPTRAAVGAVAVVLLGLAVAPPSVALVAGGLALAAGLLPGGRALLVLATPAALIVSRAGLRPSLAWLAVLLLAADLLLRERRGELS